MKLEFEMPLRTVSLTNQREHWTVKAKRARSQRQSVAQATRKHRKSISPVIVVTLTRVSPRQLDDDNLRGALKSIRDGLAAMLLVDDRTPLIRWEYGQQTGEPGVKVTVEAV